MVYSKADDLTAKYVNVYPDDDDDGVEFMCGEYAADWEALALLLADQRDALNADLRLSKKQKKEMEAQLGTRTDEGLIKMIHGLLSTDGDFDSMPKKDIEKEQLFGVVQRECRDSQVSVKGLERDILGMKRRLYEKRRWVFELDEDDVQYDIKAIVGMREDDERGTLYRVQWSDDTETEEPLSSLVNVPEMVAEFNAKRREAAPKARVARGKKVRYGDAGGHEETGSGAMGSAGGGAGTSMTEVEKMLVVLGNSMATIANSMGSGKKETTEEKELEGSDGMLPGTRDLMGGRKRLKQVGADHFMEEKTVKRTRRAIMMDAKLPFAELYNEKLDELLVVEARKLECKHQLRELRGREATEKNVRQMEAKKVRMELIEEDWMVVDDTLDLLQECSDHALTGQVASAWQVWENAKK